VSSRTGKIERWGRSETNGKRDHIALEKQMARALKAKKLAHIAANREGSIYRLQVEDEAGKKTLFELTSDQALLFADTFDRLLAAEEEEQGLARSPPNQAPPGGPERLGIVKWYDAKKGFGFVTPNGGGQEVFLHRSVLEQAGMTDLAEGTRVCFHTLAGKRGPQVSMLALV
jgi:cold shock protein